MKRYGHEERLKTLLREFEFKHLSSADLNSAEVRALAAPARAHAHAHTPILSADYLRQLSRCVCDAKAKKPIRVQQSRREGNKANA